MFKCIFCKKSVSDKGFRAFLKVPMFNVFGKKKGWEMVMGEGTFQIRICEKCKRKNNNNLQGEV